MQVDIENFSPDYDLVNITVGGNNDVVISVSRDEDDLVHVTVTNNATGEDRTMILGREGVFVKKPNDDD